MPGSNRRPRLKNAISVIAASYLITLCRGFEPLISRLTVERLANLANKAKTFLIGGL